MPVGCGVEIEVVRQEQFHAVDKLVMKHAFDIHNTLGRFCDECVYQDELAYRCASDGLDVRREARLRAFHSGFAKSYYLDLLVEHGIIYELKTVDTLNPGHQSQLINYLLLAGLHHGKLLNFHPSSVESRFVSTRLQREDRSVFHIDDHDWAGQDDSDSQLRNRLIALLTDWGAFLDVNLYRDALLHFTAGMNGSVQKVDIRVGDRMIGTHPMCMLCNGAAWHISSVRGSLAGYETHLLRLLRHTATERMHWINLSHRNVTLKTLRK